MRSSLLHVLEGEQPTSSLPINRPSRFFSSYTTDEIPMGSSSSSSAVKFCEDYEGFMLVALYFPDRGYWHGYLGRRDGGLIEVDNQFNLKMQATEIPELHSTTELVGFDTCNAGDFNIDPDGKSAYANRMIYSLRFPRFWGKEQVLEYLKETVVRILSGATPIRRNSLDDEPSDLSRALSPTLTTDAYTRTYCDGATF